MADQIFAIQNAQFSDRFRAITEAPRGKLRPIVVYLGTEKPGYDAVVDDDFSAESIGKDAEAVGLPYLHYEVPGAVHTRPDLATDAYEQVLIDATPEIQAALKDQRDRYNLTNHTIITRPLSLTP